MGTVDEEQVGLFVEHSSRIDPLPSTIPTSLGNRLRAPLPRAARAVLFDIYGTLVISASGEIGIDADAKSEAPFTRAYQIASGMMPRRDAEELMARTFREGIERRHAAARDRGLPYPEVDIVAVWRDVLSAMGEAGLEPAPVDVELLAIAYETAANPAWPTPDAAAVTAEVRARGVPMGIVSNAQFYTPLLFPALFGASLVELGFDPRLIAFSYKSGRAKPDPTLFEAPLASLRDRGIDSSETVYVGNDVRNDVWCAGRAGCMTALYAGDARSFRARENDPDLKDTVPDSVITSLSELPAIARLTRNMP